MEQPSISGNNGHPLWGGRCCIWVSEGKGAFPIRPLENHQSGRSLLESF